MSAGASGEATPGSRVQWAEKKYILSPKIYILLSTNFKLLRQSGYSINVIFKFLNFSYGRPL